MSSRPFLSTACRLISVFLTKGFLGAIVARPDAIAALGITNSVSQLCAERPTYVSANTTEPGKKKRSSEIAE